MSPNSRHRESLHFQENNGATAHVKQKNMVSMRSVRLDVHSRLDHHPDEHLCRPDPSSARHVPWTSKLSGANKHGGVKFLSHGDGYSLFLTAHETVFMLRTTAGVKSPPSVFRMELKAIIPSGNRSG